MNHFCAYGCLDPSHDPPTVRPLASLEAEPVSPHAACAGCPHPADEHTPTGCLSFTGNTATRCTCPGWTPTA